MPYLVALTGPYAGEAFEVKDGRMTVGRGPACDLVLAQDTAVSRAHALLVCAGGVVQVQDAGSMHGVYVNGQRVTQVVLRNGDCVQVGGSAFQLQPVPAQVGQPPRLRMVMPSRGALGPDGLPGDTPINPGLGCLYVALAILMPIPFGFIISRLYLSKKNPANQRFGTACLIVTVLSTLAQLAVSALLFRQIYQMFRPLMDTLGEPGM